MKRAAAKTYGVKLEAMDGPGKGDGLSNARAVAWYILRRLTPLSLPELGRCFGDRHHTTVLYALRRIDERPAMQAAVRGLLWRLRDAAGLTPACRKELMIWLT